MFPWVGICHSYWSSEIKMLVEKNMVDFPNQLQSVQETGEVHNKFSLVEKLLEATNIYYFDSQKGGKFFV